MSAKPATRLLSGQTEVVTAQTAVQLTTASREVICNAVTISFARSNTGTQVAIGGSKTTVNAKKELAKEEGVILEKGQSVRIETADPSQIWVDVEKSKDCVTWVLEIA